VLRAQGIQYQRRMMAAMQAGDADSVHTIMSDHMAYAERSMLDLQAQLNGDFLHDPVARGRTGKRRKGTK
jgi:DNA-binding FadR family transcriptional regulator